ncbi:MAG: replicative DNA helicase [Bacteroidia bacterium]|nr:replicative DNA helicase [Bacteroidia bacterium]
MDNNKTKFTRKKDTKQFPVELITGKLPPQALELEEAVLGALMIEKNALSVVLDILKADYFYKDSHQLIFKAILGLFDKSEPVDILTVTNQLRLDGTLEICGGPYYITQLTNRVASAANIEFHARIIQQKFIQRELIRISGEVQRDAFEETTDVFDLLDQTENKLYQLTEGNISNSSEKVDSILKEAIKQIESLKGHEDGLTGIPSGFTALDRLTSGWQKSDLIILAARPGMGKTAFVLGMARNAAVIGNNPVALFSLEMSSIQLVNRLIASETNLEAEKLKKGQLREDEWVQLNKMVGKLSEAPIFIDDTPALSIFELRAKCRKLKSQHNIQLVIIDYLQLMRGDESRSGGNREQEISYISRSLKALAKELNIPVIALSQLSRAVETRGGDKRPMLSDLRESGSIEQDADMVSFIYRPEYYGFNDDQEGNSLVGIAEIIVAKHRNGATDTVKLKFVNKFARFENLDMFSYSDDADYEPSNMITLPSRMNNMNDEEAPPF